MWVRMSWGESLEEGWFIDFIRESTQQTLGHKKVVILQVEQRAVPGIGVKHFDFLHIEKNRQKCCIIIGFHRKAVLFQKL